jgi:RND family efflux transporter MFP subunit
MLRLRAPLLALLLVAAPFATLHAHEGHDHGDAPPPPEIRAAPRATAASEAFELVAVAENGGLTIWLDRFATNEPVVGATIDVETPAGPAIATATGEVYRLDDAPWAGTPGSHELLFTVADGAAFDFLTAALTIPEPKAAPAPAATPLSLIGAALAREAAETLAVDLPAQLDRNNPAVIAAGVGGFLLGGLVVALARRRRAAAVATAAALALLIGGSFAQAQEAAPIIRDVAQRLPDGRVFAPKSAQRILAIRTLAVAPAEHRRRVEMPGRVIPDPNASGFVQTAVGGRLAPPPGGFPPLGARVEAGQVLAYVEPSLAAIDLSDIRQSQGALDQEIAIAARQVERFRRLTDSGAVSRTQLEEAEITLDGLRARRAALDDVRLAPEPLVAPVGGVIAAANAAAGMIAEPQAVVFHIVDPDRLWVEALSYGGEPVGAHASAASGETSLSLAFVGAGVAEQGRARPLHFRVENAAAARPGAMLTVLAETEEAVAGMAAPRDSVIRAANGEDVVYVHVAPEVFAPRAVRVAPLDGGQVLIVAGVEAGERIVTHGAELLGQLR